MSEIWKEIPGWEGFYQVSNLGRVRSLDRMVFAGARWGDDVYRLAKGVILRPGFNKISGYPYVSLVRNGAGTSFNVHSLVASTFLGPRPDGLETRHVDGNPRNPALSNLAYGTHVENMADCVEHGTRATGERLPHAVTAKRAAEIITILATRKISQRKLAKEIGINRATIMKIVSGAHWSMGGASVQ